MKKKLCSLSQEDWIAYGKKFNKIIAFYEDKALDLTQLAKSHPGGSRSITKCIFTDIQTTFFSIHSHRNLPLNRLLKHQCGKIKKKSSEPKEKLNRQEKIFSSAKENMPNLRKKQVCGKDKEVKWRNDVRGGLSEDLSLEEEIGRDQEEIEENKNQLEIPLFVPKLSLGNKNCEEKNMI